MVTASPDFKQRQLTVQKAMQAEGLSALVAYGLSSYAGSGSNAHGYIRYLTGWTARFAASMLLLPAEGSPTLLVPGAHDVLYAKQSFPWVERCQPRAPRNYGSLCRRILLDWGCQKVGWSGSAKCLIRSSGSGGQGGWLYLHPCRCHHRCLAANKGSCRNSLPSASSGHFRSNAERPSGSAEQFPRPCPETGCGDGVYRPVNGCGNRYLLASYRPARRSPALPAGGERARGVQDGDQVPVGTYVTYRGYWAHCLRMGSVGSPSEQYRRTYEAAINQHRAAAAQVRPGNDARQIQAEAIRAAEEAIPGSLNNAVWFRQAHFMGLDYAEKPSSAFPQPENWTQNKGSKPNEVILRPGMLLEVHTNLGGAGGVGFGVVGDTYLVTEDGAERITGFPQELFEA